MLAETVRPPERTERRNGPALPVGPQVQRAAQQPQAAARRWRWPRCSPPLVTRLMTPLTAASPHSDDAPPRITSIAASAESGIMSRR
jgi:hypothetical protein